MAHAVGVVGASGYGGGELLRLLAGHPAIDVAAVAAHSNVGEAVVGVFPNLDLAGDRTFDAVDIDRLAGLDLVFLATPHGPSMEIGGQLVDAGVPVVDLSGAFRLSGDEFASWYGQGHVRPELLGDGGAVYGLTEYARGAVADATIVANPGCYPTATLLGLLPLAGLLRPGSVVVDAKSGTSGAGRGVADHLHHPHVHGDLAAYGAPGHRHTPEIERWLRAYGGRDLGAVTFTPHLVPTARGLLATCYGQGDGDVTADDVQGALVDRYDDEPFVRVLDPGTFPHSKALAGSNGCQVSAVLDQRTGRVTVTSAIDNLGKGAAGQAMQNANLLLGLDETLGLTATGVYP